MPAGISLSPILIAPWVTRVVASSEPVRQALPQGTNPPQILRIVPVFGSFE